jgi:hypothetical protein
MPSLMRILKSNGDKGHPYFTPSFITSVFFRTFVPVSIIILLFYMGSLLHLLSGHGLFYSS